MPTLEQPQKSEEPNLGTDVSEDIGRELCRMGQEAACCSYLGAGRTGLCCFKGSVFEKQVNDRRAKKSMVAMSDNCSGPPDFTPTSVAITE